VRLVQTARKFTLLDFLQEVDVAEALGKLDAAMTARFGRSQ